jgi:hypothetical protein
MRYLKKVFNRELLSNTTPAYIMIEAFGRDQNSSKSLTTSTIPGKMPPHTPRFSMKTRNGTRSLLRTYVKTHKSKKGETKYESTIVNNKTHETFGCTKKSVREAVVCLKKKVGVK